MCKRDFFFPWDEKRDVKSGTLHDDTVGGVTELFQQDDMIPAFMWKLTISH